MGKVAGGALRLLGTLFYALEFCCAAIVLGIYSYFLAKLSIHNLPIKSKWKAVEGLSGVAVIYTFFAVILTFFLGGNKFFGFLAILLNLAFCGAFIAIAVLTDDGTSCSGVVTTPLGTGQPNLQAAGTHLSFACHLNTAAFAVAIIGAFCFFISLIVQIFVIRHHQKEKKYGPSPANNYTSGSGNRKFWKRKQTPIKETSYSAGQAEMGTTGAYRASGEAPYAANDTYANGAYTNGTYANGAKYESASGYQTGPAATTVNPYGYTNSHPTGTAVNY